MSAHRTIRCMLLPPIQVIYFGATLPPRPLFPRQQLPTEYFLLVHKTESCTHLQVTCYGATQPVIAFNLRLQLPMVWSMSVHTTIEYMLLMSPLAMSCGTTLQETLSTLHQ